MSGGSVKRKSAKNPGWILVKMHKAICFMENRRALDE